MLSLESNGNPFPHKRLRTAKAIHFPLHPFLRRRARRGPITHARPPNVVLWEQTNTPYVRTGPNGRNGRKAQEGLHGDNSQGRSYWRCRAEHRNPRAESPAPHPVLTGCLPACR